MKFSLCFLTISFIFITFGGIEDAQAQTKQYFVSETLGNFYQAYHFCRAQGMQLLTLTSAADTQALEDHLIDRDYDSTAKLWSSGTRLGNEVDFFWLSTGKFIIYTNWNDGEPNNSGGDEACVEIWRNNATDTSDDTRLYRWNDVACTFERPFVCETT